MSDQGSTNPVFNKQLSELKQTLMPEVIESWDELSDETRVQVSTISSYFCKMHIFVNMASEVDKCLSLFENNIACGRNPFAFNLSESGATRLTRTTCKGLSLGGCEKSGVGGHFSTFLQEKGKKNYLLTFRGHRFNHLFYAAGAVYHHASDVSSFLSNWVNPNDLLKSVHFDISEKSFLSGIRALGIIDKLITGPLWRHIESANNILDLNPILLTLKTKLEEFSKNAHPLLSGTPVFSEMIIHKDDIYESLFKDTGEPSFDAYTQMALELISGGMLLILERQAKDQLPGGKFFEPSFDETVRASNVPTTNTCSERDFAQLDVLMRCKPSAGTTAYESIIMWTNNKTSNWLSSLSEQEREDILDDARKNAPSMQRSIREKKENLFLEKVKLLKLRGEKKEAQEQKLYTQKVTLTRKLNEIGGLWMNDGDILAQKTHLPSQAFKEALITQLQFRKSVLHCKGPREKFQQSLKGRPFTVEELEDNLKSIILLNLEAEMEDEPHIVYHDISDAKDKVETSKLSLIKKINEGRNKITVQQQARLLPSFIQDPSKLVGKQIKHRCREENSPEVSWYHAIVQGLVKEKGKRSIYRVVYEENEDDAWEFPLLVDFGKGDLIILD
ncbi:hypothetical protein FSP39_014699 [Pinctada imbricata]|uniref:Uncharacterized protein n=2 Tax=Pinctada imbricata TaxID=66713 RepID=A0AA88XKC5_PINIB|nr:hypothetical protein FSP39_014699 [Pinctada imbricata]